MVGVSKRPTGGLRHFVFTKGGVPSNEFVLKQEVVVVQQLSWHSPILFRYAATFPWGITQKEVLPKLQRIVVGLEADPALLEDFRMMHWIPRRENQTVKPIVIDVDANEDEHETAEDTFDARQFVSDTAALFAFTKHFNFDGLVFSTLLDEHGGFWVRAKEVAQALGYKAGASSIAHNVDAERHYSLQELLSQG